jgi:hypothetical protein
MLTSPIVAPGPMTASVSSPPSAERIATLTRPEITTISVSPGSPMLHTT